MGFEELNQAFEKLLFHLVVATYYEPYKDDWVEYSEMLKLVVDQKIKYDTTENFAQLDLDVLEDVHLRSLPLLEKYAIEYGNYAEQIEVWSDALLNIQKKLFLIKEKNN